MNEWKKIQPNENNFEIGGVSELLAPNGKPSNLTPEQYKLVRTSEFKEWFGDWEKKSANASRIVDENGEPLVVWRGVKSNRNYEYQKTGYNYFAKNKSYGKVYGDILHPFFLNIRNPLDLEFFNKISSENGLTSFNNEGLFQIGDLQLTNQFENETTLLYLDDLNDVADKFYYLFENGDGIIGYDIGYYGKELVFVTKQPNQIKLADGNNTKFDGNNPDIRFDGGGEVLSKEEKELFKYLIENWKQPYFRNQMDSKQISLYEKLVKKGIIVKGGYNNLIKQYYSDNAIENINLAYQLVGELNLNQTQGGLAIIRAYNYRNR